MPVGYTQFVCSRTQLVTNKGNHDFLTAPSVPPLSTLGQIGQFLPSEPKRTADKADAELIQLLQAKLQQLTTAITGQTWSTSGEQFKHIDTMNELVEQAEVNRRVGNTAAMKMNIRRLNEVGSTFNVSDFDDQSQLNEILQAILENSAKYAHFDGTETMADKEAPPHARDIEHEIDRYRRMNEIPGMYKRYKSAKSAKRSAKSAKRSTKSAKSDQSAKSGQRTSAKSDQRTKYAHQRPGVKKRVRLTNSAATGKIADMLKHGPRNLILISQGHVHYAFQYNSGNYPKSDEIRKDDVVVEDIIYMDKPDVLKTGMLVQVKYTDQPWWTGKYMEDPATKDQLDKLKKELDQGLNVLKLELQELKRSGLDESSGPTGAAALALGLLPSPSNGPTGAAALALGLLPSPSDIEDKKQEIVQYKRQAREQYEKLQRGLYVVEDNIAKFVDASSTLEKWEFVPYGDDADEWRFPDCPLITMSTKYIRVLNADGVFEPVTVTEIGETGGWDDAPEHIVIYERQGEPSVGYILDTWLQQYKMGWDDEKTEESDDPDHVHTSEPEEENASDMDDVWEPAYGENNTVVFEGQRGTVSNVDYQNRSYTIALATSAAANIKESQLTIPKELQYNTGRIVLYDFAVCRITQLNAESYDLEKSNLEMNTIEDLREQFEQASTNENWKTFIFKNATILQGITDKELELYCLIHETQKKQKQKNKEDSKVIPQNSHTIWKANGVTQHLQKLINVDGKKTRNIQKNSTNITEPVDVNLKLEKIFRREGKDKEIAYVPFEKDQEVEVYNNEELKTAKRRVASLKVELIQLKSETRPKWRAVNAPTIETKKLELTELNSKISGQCVVGTIVAMDKQHKSKEPESYFVMVNGRVKLYNVSQLGKHDPVTHENENTGDYKSTESDDDDDEMAPSADEADDANSDIEPEWVPIADIDMKVKINETSEILRVISIDYDAEQTTMNNDKAYNNDDFIIYLPDSESEPDNEEDYQLLSDDTDSSGDEEL